MTNEFFDNHDAILEAFAGKTPDDMAKTATDKQRAQEEQVAKWRAEENERLALNGLKIGDRVIWQKRRHVPGKEGIVVGVTPNMNGPFDDVIRIKRFKEDGDSIMVLAYNVHKIDEATKDLPKGQKEADFAGEIDKNYKGPSPEEIRMKKILDPIRKDIIAYLKKHPIEAYLDYSDKLSDEHIEQIIEKDAEDGYYAVRDEIEENNWEWQSESENELFKAVQQKFDLEEPDYDAEAEDDGNFIEVSDLRDEFRDYIEYGDGIGEQLIDKASAHVFITLLQQTTHEFSLESTPADVTSAFKELIRLSGGTLTAKALYESFKTIPVNDEVTLAGVTIGGEVDLRDIVNWKVKSDTKYLRVRGGLQGFGDYNGDAGSPTKDMGLKEVIMRNIIEEKKDERGTWKNSLTIALSYDKDGMSEAHISLTLADKIPGFNLKAAQEVSKLPVVMAKIEKWFNEIEAENAAEDAKRVAREEEQQRYMEHRIKLADMATALILKQPIEYWSGAQKYAEAAASLKIAFEEEYPEAKLFEYRFLATIQQVISTYAMREQERKAKEEKKKKHREAYDASRKTKSPFHGKSWEDMYPEDSEKEPTTEALSGKSPEDKAETAMAKDKKYKGVEVEILQPSLGPTRQESFWYDGPIARVNYKGRTIEVLAGGFIRARIGDARWVAENPSFDGDSAREEALDRGYTDDDLADKVEFDNNNWFSFDYVINGQVADESLDSYSYYEEVIDAAKDSILNDTDEYYNSIVASMAPLEESEEPHFHLSGKSDDDKDATRDELAKDQEEVLRTTFPWVRTAKNELEYRLECKVMIEEVVPEDGYCLARIMHDSTSNNGELGWMLFKDVAAAHAYALKVAHDQIVKEPSTFETDDPEVEVERLGADYFLDFSDGEEIILPSGIVAFGI